MTSKVLNSFSSYFVPAFIKQKYPLYEQFIKSLLQFIDEKNGTGFFTTSEQEKANSIYKNYADLVKFGNIDDIPIENKTVLQSYYINWCLSYSTYRTQFQDDEYFRLFIKYSNILYKTKGTYKAYDFFIKLIQKSIINNVNVNLYFEPYLNTHADDTNPPSYYSILDVVSVVGYQLGETVTGATSGATAVIKYIDTVNNDLFVIMSSEQLFTLPENIVGNDTGTTSACAAGLVGVKHNHIIYSELPVYYIDDSDGLVKRDTMINDDKGRFPFQFQVISSSQALNDYNFIQILRGNLKPAGFDMQVFKDYDELDIYILEWPAGIIAYNIQAITNVNPV